MPSAGTRAALQSPAVEQIGQVVILRLLLQLSREIRRQYEKRQDPRRHHARRRAERQDDDERRLGYFTTRSGHPSRDADRQDVEPKECQRQANR